MNYLSSLFYTFPTQPQPGLKDIIEFGKYDYDKYNKSKHELVYTKVMKELVDNSVYVIYPEIFQYLYGWVLSRGELEYYNHREVLTIDIKNNDEYKLFENIISKLDNPNYYINYIEWLVFARHYIFVIQDKHMVNLFKNNKYSSSVTKTKYFCRGFFEGCEPTIISTVNGLTCKLKSYWIIKFYKQYIEKYYAICGQNKYTYIWYDMDALSFLGELYNRNGNILNSIDELLQSDSIVYKFNRAKTFELCDDPPQFICNKLVPEAVYPYKNNMLDVGFNVKLLNRVEVEGEVEYYRTGLQIYPDYGYYMEVYGNELYKSGYTLATRGNYILESSDDEVVIPLVKVGRTTTDKDLYVKLIPKRMYMCEVKSYQSESESVSELKSYTTTGESSISEQTDLESESISDIESM